MKCVSAVKLVSFLKFGAFVKFATFITFVALKFAAFVNCAKFVALESVMRNSGWTPSIVPNDDDQTAYIVVDDFGPIGRSFRETGVGRADLEAVVMGLLEGQYADPVRVVGFNTVEGWSKDVSADVAREIRYRCDLQMRDVPFYLESFVERHEGRYKDVQLPLPMRLV